MFCFWREDIFVVTGFYFLFFVCLPQNSFHLVLFLLMVTLNNRGIELPKYQVTGVARQVEPGTWSDHDAWVKPATSLFKQPRLHRSLEHTPMALTSCSGLISQSSRTAGSKAPWLTFSLLPKPFRPWTQRHTLNTNRSLIDYGGSLSANPQRHSQIRGLGPAHQ